jgi:CubicO group peptidase (beta-lactamase class C family)
MFGYSNDELKSLSLKDYLAPEWIDEITYLHSHTKKPEKRKLEGGYGYLWWISDVNKDEQLYGAYSALGDKGQSIIVVPKLNLIIVTKYYLGFQLLLPKILGMFS